MTKKTQNLASIEAKPSPFQPLFENLSHVIDVSRKKFDLERASNADKQRWARLLITGCEAFANLLETRKLEALEERLAQIERSGQTQTFSTQAIDRTDILSRLKRQADAEEAEARAQQEPSHE
jgi:hypothetical protein